MKSERDRHLRNEDRIVKAFMFLPWMVIGTILTYYLDSDEPFIVELITNMAYALGGQAVLFFGPIIILCGLALAGVFEER